VSPIRGRRELIVLRRDFPQSPPTQRGPSGEKIFRIGPDSVPDSLRIHRAVLIVRVGDVGKGEEFCAPRR
jgi:hypothetical protein